MEAILKTEGLRKTYGKGENKTKALDGVSFQVMKGEFVGIMGSSGSGKTTLLNCLATVIHPDSGKIFLGDRSVTELHGKELTAYRGKKTGYLFQSFELVDNLTGRENILLPVSLHEEDGEAGEKRLALLSDYFDIDSVLDKFPSSMSGGEKQRVAAARALILNPEIVFADEPTGALDSRNAKNLMEKLSNMNEKEETTILLVTHDSAAASYCGRILFIQDGKIFHELRRDVPRESKQDFYGRILKVMASLAEGSADVI